jgi:hypothetical protein
MNLEYVQLLQVQRDLYKLPRGFERFQEYLRTMIDEGSGDLKLPLPALNPMGKDHVPLFLDRLLDIDADGQGRNATIAAEVHLRAEPGAYKVCLVASDDLLGGWTNRYTSEFDYRFRQRAYYKRRWIAALLWTSESYTTELIQQEVMACIFRGAYIQRHNEAHTLGEMLRQEGTVMTQSGVTGPTLDQEDLEYTREVLAPYLERTDLPTLIAALFGDTAARQLGYSPMGLSPRAGLALALADAHSEVGLVS